MKIETNNGNNFATRTVPICSKKERIFYQCYRVLHTKFDGIEYHVEFHKTCRNELTILSYHFGKMKANNKDLINALVC